MLRPLRVVIVVVILACITVALPAEAVTIVRPVKGVEFSSTHVLGTRWANCTGGRADGVPIRRTITPTMTTLISVNQTSGSYAWLTLWKRVPGTACHFTAVLKTPARLGGNGLVEGTQRKQNSYTTPAGTYTMTQSFGNGALPVTALPYRVTGANDYWVEDNDSPFYNSYRSSLQGGFDLADSEHLRSFGTVYRYAVVIDFNMPPTAVRHRGAGIFLHVNGPGATAGCVSVSQAAMVQVMATVKPGDLIAIGW